MIERRSLFMLVVLVLGIVIPMAVSANLGSAKETPIPIMATVIPTPIVARPTATPITGVFNPEVPEDGPDPQAMEEFRSDLLSLTDTLNKLVDETYPTVQVNGEQLPPSRKMPRQLSQELTHEELYFVQQAFVASSIDLKVFEDLIETMRSLASEAKGFGEGEKGLGASLNSFTVIPTPTPTDPGIEHSGHSDKNIAAGDIFIKEGGTKEQTPGYPTDVGCPLDGYDARLIYFGQTAVSLLEVINKSVKYGCKSLIVICGPFGIGGGTTIPQCIAKTVVDGLFVVVKAVFNGFKFCNSGKGSAEMEAIFNNTQILHADLMDHDNYLQARADAIDQFLFDFRNLNLRARIEANLASPSDDPISLLTLPSNVCITDTVSGGLNAEVIGQPNAPLTQERLRRCGLLEVVSDTVRSAIDLNALAGQDVNNAKAEFDAAVAHFDNGEWKLAYARFRKAFREAVRP